MKAKLAYLAFLSALTVPAFAIFGVGDVVHDPINYGVMVETKVETMGKWAESIKKAEDQILNQVRMIEQAKNLLNTQNLVKTAIGDWASVIQKGKSIKLGAENLGKDWNVNLRLDTMLDYHSTIRPSYSDAYGNDVIVKKDDIETYNKLDELGRKTMDTIESTATDIKETNKEIADTYEEMTKPGLSQQEYEKLRGKVQTLGIRLDGLHSQQRAAMEYLQAQATASANQREREREIARQTQEATHQATARGFAAMKVDELKWR